MTKRMWSLGAAFALLVLSASGVQAANGVAVNAGSALGGTNFGLQVTVTDNLTSTYVSSQHPNDESHLLVRFRIDPALMNFPTGTGGGPNSYFRMMHWIETGDAAQKIFFLQRVPGTGNIHFIAWNKETSGANNFRFVGGFFFSAHASSPGGGNNQIQCEWTRATSAAANDGSMTCTKVNTAQTFTVNNLDDFNTDIDEIRVGYINFDTFNGTGSYKFDEYESYR